ncbi:MAG TPA: hypothetical protein VNO23_17485 [Candidatus Binatia bacterium]|nr:hypothetical protein [Candidatus Binatia bacterium]
MRVLGIVAIVVGLLAMLLGVMAAPTGAVPLRPLIAVAVVALAAGLILYRRARRRAGA